MSFFLSYKENEYLSIRDINAVSKLYGVSNFSEERPPNNFPLPIKSIQINRVISPRYIPEISFS